MSVIQKNRIECEVVAWGRNKQSWSVDYFVLDGDTAKLEVWQRLADVLNKDYPHESGITMPIQSKQLPRYQISEKRY